MAQKTYAGVTVEVTDEGYFTDPTQWTREIAAEIAKEEGIELTEKHYEIIEYLRNKQKNGETLTIRGINKSGIVDVKTFYGMFPGRTPQKIYKNFGHSKTRELRVINH